MTEMEKQIWTAAFAQQYMKEKRLTELASHLSYKDISGFTCGEWANEAVKKYREALVCEDAEYLLPVKEKWND